MDVLEELGQVGVPEQRQSEDSGSKEFSLVVGEHPDGTDPAEIKVLTVKEFATELTWKNFEKGERKQVEPADIYNAIKAKRHPLPVVLIGERAYLPAQAFEVWENRPVRGEGTSAAAPSKRSDEELIKLTAEKQKALAKTAERIEKLLARRDKEAELVKKYTRQLVERFGEDEAAAKVAEYVAANPDSETEENN